MTKACEVWEVILQSYPTDMLALKLAHDCYFYLGDKINLINSLEKVFPIWKDSLPLYNFLFGMKAFALCENKDYVNSEIAARKVIFFYKFICILAKDIYLYNKIQQWETLNCHCNSILVR